MIRGLVWCGRGVISLTQGVRRVAICLPGRGKGMVLSLWERDGWDRGRVTGRPTTHLWSMVVNICDSKTCSSCRQVLVNNLIRNNTF